MIVADLTPPPHAPFLCPHCSQPCDSIDTVVNGRMLIMFHSGEGACLKVLSCQIIHIPAQPRPAGSIIIPQ